MSRYYVENQWGGDEAPWHPGGVFSIGNRVGQRPIALSLTSKDGGQTLSGTMTYVGEGPIGVRGERVNGNTYRVENQWGGDSAPWHDAGSFELGGRVDQRVVAIDVTSSDAGETLRGTMTYAGEGAIGFCGRLRVRRSVRELWSAYEAGDKRPLEDLLRAWIGIKAADPDSYNSFFVIGGYHGEPFVGQGARSNQYWGGYCNHGNVLFPTWHRVYVLRLEQALQSIVPSVMMPYWDETSDDTLKHGIPRILTDEKVTLDGVEIDNPLRSYVLQKRVNDAVKGDDNNYTKPAGYETVRYPLSGLVGTADLV